MLGPIITFALLWFTTAMVNNTTVSLNSYGQSEKNTSQNGVSSVTNG